MKNILITGGAGKIGFNLVQKLLSESYNITILDLESKTSIKKLMPIKDQIKIVYGDINDYNLVRNLVRRNDIVVDYAGVMPPFANLNENIANDINYLGTKNIVDAINEVNKECILIYMSFISVYGISKKKRKLKVDEKDYELSDLYSLSIKKGESYIKNNIKDYVILRMPIVLTRKNYFINHIVLDKEMNFITCDDLNEIVIETLKTKKMLGKTLNIEGLKCKSSDVVMNVYKVSGHLSLFNRKLYYGEVVDGEKINKILKLNNNVMDLYYVSIKEGTTKFKIILRKIINYPKYLYLKKRTKK